MPLRPDLDPGPLPPAAPGHGEVRVVGEGLPADLQRPAEGLALDLRTQLRSLLALFRKYDSKKKFQPTATEIPAINIQKNVLL